MDAWDVMEIVLACIAILLFLSAGATGELTGEGRFSP